MLVVPAVLPGSRQEFAEELALLTGLPHVTRIQIDVVDGKFVAPASWPYTAPGELEDMAARGEMLPHLHRVAYEIDLMCLDASGVAGSWLALGASRLTLHAESATDLPRLLAAIHKNYSAGAQFSSGLITVGLALNVGSDLALIEGSLNEIEYVQFMGIANIGKQGQPFDIRVLERVQAFHKKYPEIPIQVDGGVSLENAEELLTRGATDLVVGSAIVRAADPVAAFAAFNAL